MATQQMFYDSVVPVSATRHRNSCVRVGTEYAFSRKVNSVPLTAVEFPHAAAEYVIVFAGTEEAVMPAVILGLRGNENLYLAGANSWQAKYIPAFVRRYPFVFSSNDEGKTFTLCIDEGFAGFNQAGLGERLFDAEGKRTQFVENVLAFLQEYQVQFQRTRALCRKLKELKLLDPMRAEIMLSSGEQVSLTGFMTVSRERLKALSAEVLAEMARSDELELVYLHLQSMRNFADLKNRVPASASAAANADAGAEAPAAAVQQETSRRPEDKDASAASNPAAAKSGPEAESGKEASKKHRSR